ncbi:E3 ubiquitin-protein ligase mind-bomb-like [Cotesia glomerata]|nr:E3 ubiquitin-protein ligase mind-bomb-like [Cotesia glomerata]
MFFDQYILPEELTIVSIDLDAELDLLLSPPRPWLFENNDYDPENDDDDDDGIERPVLYRSSSVLEDMKRIINELQPPDEDDEDIDVNNEYNVRCTRCKIALVTAVNLPCKHVEMCNNCASRRINNCCSVCQESITRTERIFLPTDSEGNGYSLRCEICYSNVANIMWTTCNHGLSCKTCAVQVATQDGLGLTTTSKIRCPHCNLEVEGMVEFKLMKHTENN